MVYTYIKMKSEINAMMKPGTCRSTSLCTVTYAPYVFFYLICIKLILRTEGKQRSFILFFPFLTITKDDESPTVACLNCKQPIPMLSMQEHQLVCVGGSSSMEPVQSR